MLRFQYPMFPGRGPNKREDEAKEPASEELSEAENIAAWRYLMLLGLGFSPDDALHLIRNPTLNWHEAKRLQEKGCPTDLIIRLLEA